MKKTVLWAGVTLLVLGFTQVQAQEVRNLKNVISGKFARSGATNRSPLSDSALKRLCEDGYGVAVYIYSGGRDKTVSCGGGREIKYYNITNWQNATSILNKTEAAMDAGRKTLVHCWNGVHASNYVSAAALNRFCGFSGQQAATYFRQNIPDGTLDRNVINNLARKLESLGSGGQVVSGCPSPR